MKKSSTLLLGILCFQFLLGQTSRYQIHTIAFYNLENLFDTINNPNTNDEASPMFEIKNNKSKVYTQKLENMAKVIAEIGAEKTNDSPSILGVSEIENRQVLEDLLQTKTLRTKKYGIIHYEAPDLRGIDVALLYDKKKFVPISHKSYELKMWSEKGYRLYTRDQLLVSGYLENELLHILVNHWPSRRGGEKKSRPNREKAAFLNKKICDSIFKTDPNSKIILMGDLNDNPTNSSLKNILQTEKEFEKIRDTTFFNPYEILFDQGYSTLGFRDNIHLFDQIIVSGSLVSKDKKFKDFRFYKAHIFNPSYLTVQTGRYKGYPFRSFGYEGFTNGYSDHYPVYIYLLKKITPLSSKN